MAGHVACSRNDKPGAMAGHGSQFLERLALFAQEGPHSTHEL